MQDGVPVGALLQVKPKPGVEYLVLGLAAVTDWKDGYFILEGFSDQRALSATKDKPDAAHDRARAFTSAAKREDFTPDNGADFRERQIAEVVRRRGQAKFRAELIAAYDGTCAITGCDAIVALEAAHISPYRGEQTNHPQNGLLLRADLHSLFDLGLLAVDPSTMTVVISAPLEKTSYASLSGQAVRPPIDPRFAPNTEALAQHFKWSGIFPSL